MYPWRGLSRELHSIGVHSSFCRVLILAAFTLARRRCSLRRRPRRRRLWRQANIFNSLTERESIDYAIMLENLPRPVYRFYKIITVSTV